ncbi:phosphoadenylyl-sulfate reductase [Rhodobacteraceae bacterium 63075]|nr:phosphoadenylyl-sulfate reductase [Rhodobacteraceae bacterium 63075]
MLQSNLSGKVEQLGLRFAGLPAKSVLGAVLRDGLLGRSALVSSFGAEAAVLLHMVSEVAPDAPVLFIDTEMLFEETLAYQRALSAQLGLRDVRVIRAAEAEIAAQDPDGTLHQRAPDACCTLRKTVPLQKALTGFDGWISGRKRFQGGAREALPLFEAEDGTGRIKVNPLANWSPDQITAYFDAHALPRHPLSKRGYGSIGCAPCTARGAGRSGRWQGRDKSECGIHISPEGRVTRKGVPA